MEMLLGFVFGLVGMAYIIYGKKTSQFLFLITGIVLCVYPYLVPGVPAIVVVGLLLSVAPFIVQRMQE